jgi:hypothetical protein
MSYEEPMSRVLEYAMSQLCDMIEDGEVGKPKASIAMRRCFVHIVNAFPMTSSPLYRNAHEHVAFEHVIFYERIRLGISSPHYFLDGVPSSVQIFSGVTAMNPSQDSELAKLRYRDLIADRLQTVGKLEQMSNDNPRKIQLIIKNRSGLHRGIPGPVCVLVARCRAMCQGVRRVKRAQLFLQCCNLNCLRLFYTGELQEAWCNAAASSASAATTAASDDEESSSSQYWSKLYTCGGASVTQAEKPPTKRFCSSACSLEHAAHLAAMMPTTSLTMDADDVATRMGRARVAQSLKLALKRNEMAARSLRNARSRFRGNLAAEAEEVRKYREMHISALNVDIGVLYASSIIAESAVLCKNKLLPGSILYWRDDPLFWAKAVAAVAKIYSSMRRKEGIVSSMLTMPRFLEVIQAKAHTLF